MRLTGLQAHLDSFDHGALLSDEVADQSVRALQHSISVAFCPRGKLKVGMSRWEPLYPSNHKRIQRRKTKTAWMARGSYRMSFETWPDINALVKTVVLGRRRRQICEITFSANDCASRKAFLYQVKSNGKRRARLLPLCNGREASIFARKYDHPQSCAMPGYVANAQQAGSTIIGRRKDRIRKKYVNNFLAALRH